MSESLRVKDLIITDKPRERLILQGASALSDSELLAIILRSGGPKNSAIDLARKILKEFGGLKELINVDVNQLITFKNIGVAKATSIKSVCEIALRINLSMEEKRLEIKNPEDVFQLTRKEFFAQKKEHLYMISIDSRNRYICKNLISVGTINETLIHPREVYRQALLNNAVSIVLVHNHPSNDPTPSIEDIKVTERLAKAGVSLGIALVDHIIVSDNSFVSIKSLNIFDTHIFNEEKRGGD